MSTDDLASMIQDAVLHMAGLGVITIPEETSFLEFDKAAHQAAQILLHAGPPSEGQSEITMAYVPMVFP